MHPAVSPLDHTLRILCLKWIPAILRLLAAGDQRFNQLQSAITPISHKVLIDQLRELEQHGVIHREAKPGGYRRVHYSLTEWGRRLLPIIDLMEDWGREKQGNQKERTASALEGAAYEPRRA